MLYDFWTFILIWKKDIKFFNGYGKYGQVLLAAHVTTTNNN